MVEFIPRDKELIPIDPLCTIPPWRALIHNDNRKTIFVFQTYPIELVLQNGVALSEDNPTLGVAQLY